MLKLHYAPRTISIAVAMILEQAGTPYEGIRVDFASGEQTKEAYRQINPKSRVPALETPQGILSAAAIAAHPRVAGFVIGTNDLEKELRSNGRASMTTSLQLCLLAARAHGIVAIDGVYNAFKDNEGLLVECEEGRILGFDGKSLIHPGQVAITNAAFGPTDDEVELAHRQIAAFDKAVAEGSGVAVVDGRIVENLHIVTARATLAKSEAIAALENP